jgi:hypothetical protein
LGQCPERWGVLSDCEKRVVEHDQVGLKGPDVMRYPGASRVEVQTLVIGVLRETGDVAFVRRPPSSERAPVVDDEYSGQCSPYVTGSVAQRLAVTGSVRNQSRYSVRPA